MYEFLLDWMANMFQFPSSKSVMIIIQGMEGSGKSIICDLLGHMIGSGSIEIDDVKENLFGRFNDNLSRKVFVNLNEIDRKEMSQYFERIKSLITSPTINIEGKGQKKYTEQSLLHFITTTQNDNVFKITQESRRYCYFETNNELCGNTDYFNFLFNFIEKQSVQRAFYDYLMNRKVKQKITIKDIPITMAMREQFILNRDTIEDYIVEFTGDKNAQDNYNEYKTFMKNQGLEYVPSRKLFEMRFNKLMDQYDIKKKRQTIEGNRYTIYYRDSPPLLENN
jgi:putative DNA primase/helicase